MQRKWCSILLVVAILLVFPVAAFFVDRMEKRADRKAEESAGDAADQRKQMFDHCGR